MRLSYALLAAGSFQAVQCAPSSSHNSGSDNLTIKTNLFTVRGAIFPNTTDVRFFGGIPYAEPPVGDLRFRPPATAKPRNETLNATWFGPSCIQYSNGQHTVYSEYLTGFLLKPGQVQSEDCLTLNIWAPKGSKEGDALPVMIWLHGGGHTSGGAASPYKYGHRIVRDQNVILVALNYRLNIFGYPKAAALDGHNLNPGLLDQRKAVEWVYQNIHAFGGAADKMILFGQSAGAFSVDMYTYAYPSDPLVRGFIAQSGMADSSTRTFDPFGSNFTYVASQVVCNSSVADEVFSCMQSAPASSLITVYNKYNATLNNNAPLSFTPTPDNETVFANYTDRQARGLFAHLPMLISQTNDEGSSLLPFDPAGPAGGQAAIDQFTRSFSTCPSARGALARKSWNVPVWRVRYFGEWPNLNPFEWLGAYHSSDIPMVFGTSDLRGPDTQMERETSRYYQAAWAAFVRDPEKGLVEYGWSMYDPIGETLVKLGNGSVGAVFTLGDVFDDGCGYG
ncbi:alpha/beta-hydrolase [Lentithecium fluviatile CBS 122367]|uniref:Carboxylic ester hydrolase n=1 Tax=Lentithecium fluviatile CBS 122367 TaxID=1168545 RepID=A0A6G1IIY3_9PLEO|nr:alpha/beta-hydrolase [Lentithecium fluviatile CBS 122367]